MERCRAVGGPLFVTAVCTGDPGIPIWAHPDTWAAASCTSGGNDLSRPFGVTVLGVLVILAAIVVGLAGLAGIFLSFASLLPGVNLPGTALILGGLLYVVLGIVLLIGGIGLLGLRIWAWWLATLTAIVAAAWQGYGIYHALTATPAESVPWTSWVGFGFTILIAVYLLVVHHSFHRHARGAVVQVT